jgi:hypothetical protein
MQEDQMRFKEILLTITLSGLLMFMFSCHCNEPKVGTITGNVVLYNDTDSTKGEVTDFSGITVALYAPATIDTVLARLTTEYPQLGVLAAQQTEFEHSKQTPLYSTTTNAAGHYELKSVPEGEYNIVFSRNGFGWNYQYNVEINSVVNDTLYAETILDPVTNENLHLKRKHHYIVATSLWVQNLVVEANSWIRFQNESELTVLSSIQTPASEYAYFTSDNATQQGKLVINSISNAELKHLVFRRLSEAVKAVNASLSVHHVRFCDNIVGIISGTSALTIANVTFSRNDAVNYLFETDSSTYTLESSIFLGSGIAVDSRNASTGTISHCFIRAQQCVYLDAYTDTRIQNCQLEANDYVIKSLQSNLIQITDNNIIGKFGVFIRFPVITESNYINGNNIYTKYWALENSPNYHFEYQSYYFNAKNNFFNVTTADEIDAKVFDLHDQPTWYLFNFDYTPFRIVANPTAGI